MAFVETRWSLVRRAAADTAEGRKALNTLCQQYAEPLQSFLRRRGFSPDQSDDFLQSFFVRILEQDALSVADPLRGRFRTFLLATLKNSVANDIRDASTLKRGGRVRVESLDDTLDVNLHEKLSDKNLTPDQYYDRQWALHLLERSLSALEKNYHLQDKSEMFQVLQPALAWDSEGLDHAAVSEHLKVERSHLRVIVHRFRKDFRGVVQQEVLETVSNPGDVQDEIKHLFSALSGL